MALQWVWEALKVRKVRNRSDLQSKWDIVRIYLMARITISTTLTMSTTEIRSTASFEWNGTKQCDAESNGKHPSQTQENSQTDISRRRLISYAI